MHWQLGCKLESLLFVIARTLLSNLLTFIKSKNTISFISHVSYVPIKVGKFTRTCNWIRKCSAGSAIVVTTGDRCGLLLNEQYWLLHNIKLYTNYILDRFALTTLCSHLNFHIIQLLFLIAKIQRVLYNYIAILLFVKIKKCQTIMKFEKDLREI